MSGEATSQTPDQTAPENVTSETPETLESLLDELIPIPKNENGSEELAGEDALEENFEKKTKPDKGDDRVPIYDTRVYDDEGKQIGGAVYYEVEKLVESVKPKDDYILKLKQENQLLKDSLIGKKQPDGDAKPQLQAPKVPQHIIDEIKAELVAEYGDEPGEEVANAIAKGIKKYEDSLTATTVEQQQQQFLASLEPKLVEVSEKYSDYFMPPEDAAILIQYQHTNHPDYARAENTAKLVQRTQLLGGDFEAALKSLVPAATANAADLEAQIEKKVQEELRKNLLERKKKLAKVPGGQTVVAQPVKTVDYSSMSLAERDAARRAAFVKNRDRAVQTQT